MEELTTQFEELKETLVTAEAELEKFNKGNKSAGTRLRGAMQSVKGLAQTIRLGVQAQKNA